MFFLDCLAFARSCGCPSDKVAGHGCFGASLMLEPQVRCSYDINGISQNRATTESHFSENQHCSLRLWITHLKTLYFFLKTPWPESSSWNYFTSATWDCLKLVGFNENDQQTRTR